MSTRRALAFSFLDRYAGLVVHTLSSMAIARLLTPADIGVYSLVMVLLGFVAVFRDFGAGQYLVQHGEDTPQVRRATFTVQAGLGLAFAAGLFIASWPLARLYSEPRIVPLMHVLALNFAITPLMAFPTALLVRGMQFSTLAGVRLAGALAHAGVAITLAASGAGPISLAWANLATTLVGIGAVALLTQLPLAQWPTRHALRGVFRFGGGLTVASLLGTVRNGAPELLLGKLQSMADAGLMSRGQGLVQMFQQLVLDAVSSVALPYFAGERRAGRPLGPAFLRAGELILGLGWTFFGVLALLAYPITRLLYGAQWDDAVEPLRWLALAAACGLPAVICGTPLIAVGAIGTVVKASVATMVIGVVAAAVGAVSGLLAVATWQVPAGLLISAVWFVALRRHVALDTGALLGALARCACVAVAAMLPAAATVLALGWRPPGLPVVPLACLPLCGLMMLLAARYSRHMLWGEIANALPARARWLGGTG